MASPMAQSNADSAKEEYEYVLPDLKLPGIQWQIIDML